MHLSGLYLLPSRFPASPVTLQAILFYRLPGLFLLWMDNEPDSFSGKKFDTNAADPCLFPDPESTPFAFVFLAYLLFRFLQFVLSVPDPY